MWGLYVSWILKYPFPVSDIMKQLASSSDVSFDNRKTRHMVKMGASFVIFSSFDSSILMMKT